HADADAVDAERIGRPGEATGRAVLEVDALDTPRHPGAVVVQVVLELGQVGADAVEVAAVHVDAQLRRLIDLPSDRRRVAEVLHRRRAPRADVGRLRAAVVNERLL